MYTLRVRENEEVKKESKEGKQREKKRRDLRTTERSVTILII